MDSVETIYEDNFLLAINKPSGLVVNRSQTSQSNTLQDHFSENLVEEDEEFNSRNGIVHRLDKDTSGILLVAKDNPTFIALQQQFKSREVVKEYDTLVYGEITDEEFEINVPLGRNPRNRIKYAVIEGGKESLTHFKKLKTYNFEKFTATHLKCMPKTGRTHQIRVHLLAINHPIVGDSIYATKKQLDDSRENFGRMMLHATSLEFTHPTTNERLRLVTKLPDAFLLQ